MLRILLVEMVKWDVMNSNYIADIRHLMEYIEYRHRMNALNKDVQWDFNVYKIKFIEWSPQKEM